MSFPYGGVKFGYSHSKRITNCTLYTNSRGCSTDAVERLMSISSDFLSNCDK